MNMSFFSVKLDFSLLIFFLSHVLELAGITLCFLVSVVSLHVFLLAVEHRAICIKLENLILFIVKTQIQMLNTQSKAKTKTSSLHPKKSTN